MPTKEEVKAENEEIIEKLFEKNDNIIKDMQKRISEWKRKTELDSANKENEKEKIELEETNEEIKKEKIELEETNEEIEKLFEKNDNIIKNIQEKINNGRKQLTKSNSDSSNKQINQISKEDWNDVTTSDKLCEIITEDKQEHNQSNNNTIITL